MPNLVAVVPLSDSFSEVWPRLVASTGAEYVEVRAPADLAGIGSLRAVIVSAAGSEGDAAGVVQEIRRTGVVEIGAVGAENDHMLAQQLRQAGARHYFLLPAEVSELRGWLQRTLASAAREEMAREREDARPAAFARLVGSSRRLRETLDAASVISATGSSTILITGETGTGKDVLAQAIHEHSPRAGGQFVEVNCAALPASLLEGELFGHERGAFTDARTAKPGLMEAAAGGTLFLDEVGDLPMELQAKLLRAVETRRVRRLGGLREVPVDFRLIAATHVDLPQRVRERRFREDLFYRLDVLSLTLPPLRERAGDAVLLAEHFGAEFAAAYGLPLRPLSPEVRDAIQGYSWPGNVRQLRNAVERAVILGGGEVALEHLRLSPATPGSAAGLLPFPASLDRIQAAAARAAVAACAGNKSRAAQLLGISRKGLYALLRHPAGEDS